MSTALVAGGGPAGLTLARLLALRGWPVIVVDPLSPRRRRLELVSPSVTAAFRCAGIGEHLEDQRIAVPSLGICRQWGANQSWEREAFLTHRGGRGYVVDRAALDEALRRQAVEAGALLTKGRVVGVEGTSKSYIARIRVPGSVRKVAADVIIDATGRPAAVGRRLGGKRISRLLHLAYPYEAPPLPEDRRAWLNVRSHDSDWTYQLEGPAGLTEAWRLGARRPGNVWGVDASTSRLQPPAGPGWIAIGDAASAFNPIWSEGLSNALSTATTVAGALLAEGAITQVVRDVYTVAVEQGAPELRAALTDRFSTLFGV